MSRNLKKKDQSFLSENFQFLEVKFSIYMNRHVFVMGVIVAFVMRWLIWGFNM